MRSLDMYRRAVGSHALNWYADPYTGDWDELNDKGWAYLRREMLEEPATSIRLSELPSTSGYDFIYRGRLLDVYGLDATSAVSFFLPTEYMEEHGPGRVRELALELAAALPLNSGHAGLCFNFPESVLGTLDAISDLSFRHPGLDIPGVHFTSLSIGTAVNGVHWLNFLGQPVLRELEGAAGLRARLRSPGTTVQELNGERVVVTLGAWPEAGDTELGHTLPAYRELARVLEPWLHLGCFSQESLRRWERRFLD
ncbi:type VI immunity family protein [Archangium sp.]|uniref:type VI immunity family protein n=1 Tax=Archangium sp. TaxID=1872627 RepID=UPI002D2F4447|nr:type VI immunity family protein [Archangium sp.]HYO55180.1 type VI immunity family protein [Archangium sp.]